MASSIRVSLPTRASLPVRRASSFRSKAVARETAPHVVEWVLKPAPGWCKENSHECEITPPINLTERMVAQNKTSLTLGIHGDINLGDYAFNGGGERTKIEFAAGLDRPGGKNGAHMFVTDLNCSTGAYVEGKKIKKGKRVEVYPGQEIAFGSKVWTIDSSMF